MKKRFFFGAFTAFLFIGCSSGDMPSTTTTQVVNTAIIDAEATASAYAGMVASCMHAKVTYIGQQEL